MAGLIGKEIYYIWFIIEVGQGKNTWYLFPSWEAILCNKTGSDKQGNDQNHLESPRTTQNHTESLRTTQNHLEPPKITQNNPEPPI